MDSASKSHNSRAVRGDAARAAADIGDDEVWKVAANAVPPAEDMAAAVVSEFADGV
ncbi:hypothetical protein AaE_003429, partial [Aphanomyces astaci]